MKRIFSMLALCTAFGMVSAQTLKVASVIELKPGDTANIELEVNTNGVDYGSFQANLIFPATGFSTTGETTTVSTWKQGSITVGDLKDGKTNIGGLSTSDSPMPDGVVGSFEIKAADDIALGSYDVTIANFEFINGESDVKIADVSFKINIVNAYSVTLDEESTDAPKAASGVNVTVKRTIAANTWSTICLPFAMTADQLAAAFPGGVELGDFTSWASEENDEGDIVGITVGFTSVSAIEANHPYIIKVKEAVSEFTVEGVNIAPGEASVEVGKKKAEKGSFTGTYVAGETIPETDLFLNAGKFWYATSNTKTMKAYRGYFEFYDVLTEAEGAASRINITFDDVTAIKGIKTDGEEEIYTLSGQRVNKAGKGVYIVNGKKVIKK